MNEAWICGDCRSVNPSRQSRCYKCRVPRATAEMTKASAARSSSNAQRERTVLEAATRMGARFRPTWPLAMVAIATIIVAATISIEQINAWLDVGWIGPGISDADPRFQRLTSVSLAMLVALTVSVVPWSLWIAMVVANVPALVAKWPPHSPLGAFVAPFIPFVGLKRPYSVVRGVLARLSDGGGGPALLALLWWLAFLAAYFAPTVFLALNGGGGDGSPQSFAMLSRALQLRQVLLLPGAGLAIAVVLVVELQQRAAFQRRAEVVLSS